jgi:mRNA interferase RelE/StbE
MKEQDRLCEAAEDLADLRAYDGAKVALASGDEELVPADYAKRLIAGESPLRVWRELRGLSQVRLGAVSRVNWVQIADIEAGRGKGSMETVRKLADALRVRVDDLV